VRRLRSLGTIALVIAATLALTLLLQERYHHRILTLVLLWATMGLAWNIISGYAGQISFGHQAFFGIGAYTTVLLILSVRLTPWAGMLVGAAAAAVAAIVIGVPTFRLGGIYFALATLAYPLIFRILMDFLGYQEVPIPLATSRPGFYMQFADPRAYDLLSLAVFAVTLLMSHWIENSRLGYSLRALKENQHVAEAMGVDTFRCKMVAYVLSAIPAALAGAIYAHAILFVVTPDAVFGIQVIVQTLVLSLVGGAGSKWGPVLGAALMVPVSETLDATIGDVLPGIHGVVYGLALILIMLFAPEGLYWRGHALLRRRHAAPGSGRRGIAAPSSPSRPVRATAVGGPLLEVAGVSVSFLGLRAVADVSFSVAPGEILGIIGPNGAGKTTLFNALNGFLASARGTVRFRGERIDGLAPNAICRRGIGRTFQVPRTFAHLSVVENVMVGAFARERHRGPARELALQALAFVGLESHADRPPVGLTTLDLRLLELSRCVATGADLILLDEPLAGLSRDGVTAILGLIGRLRAAGFTVLLIEHTIRALLQIADRLVVLDHGSLIAAGLPGDVTKNPLVIEAYLGRRWLRHVETLRT